MAVPEPPGSSELLTNADGTNEAFAGVGQFRSSLTCTGSLIDPSSSGTPDAKAWLLTAGHCISLEAYGVIRNQPLAALVVFRFFTDTPPAARVTVRTRATGWATTKGIDLALVELDTTLGDLASRGILPLPLACSAPEAGHAVFWTGISGSPIPPEMQFVRLGRCTLGHRVQLLEGLWIWNGDLSNNCSDLYAGASGSPLFEAETGAVIGVMSTTTLLNFEHGPDYDCQVNRPCIIRRGGPALERDTSSQRIFKGSSDVLTRPMCWISNAPVARSIRGSNSLSRAAPTRSARKPTRSPPPGMPGLAGHNSITPTSVSAPARITATALRAVPRRSSLLLPP